MWGRIGDERMCPMGVGGIRKGRVGVSGGVSQVAAKKRWPSFIFEPLEAVIKSNFERQFSKTSQSFRTKLHCAEMKFAGVVSVLLCAMIFATMVSDAEGAGRRVTKRSRIQWEDSSDEEDDQERVLPMGPGPAVASVPSGDTVADEEEDDNERLNGVDQMGASWAGGDDTSGEVPGAVVLASVAVAGAVAGAGTMDDGPSVPSVPAAPVLRSYDTCEGGAHTLFSMGRPDFCSTSAEEGGRAGWERYKRLYSRNIYTPAGRISRGFLRLVDPNDPMLGRYAYEDAVEEEAVSRRADAEARLRLRLADSRARHFRDVKAEGYPEAVAEASWDPKEKEFHARGMARIAEEEAAWRAWVWKWLRATAIVTFGCSGGKKKDDQNGDHEGEPGSDSDGSSGSTTGGGSAASAHLGGRGGGIVA